MPVAGWGGGEAVGAAVVQVGSALAFLVQVLCVLLASTVVFDLIHFLLHRFSDSRFSLLRRIGGLHLAHHTFFDQKLQHDERFARANVHLHVIPEYLTHLTVSLCLLALLPAHIILGAMAVQTAVFFLILRCGGKDINHREVETVPAYRPFYFCLPPYHLLHHAYPDAYFSSWVKLFDQLAATGASLRGKRVAMTGAGTAFGSALKELLEEHGVGEIQTFEPGQDTHPGDLSKLAGSLRDIDILVVGHGGTADDRAEASSYVALIELFRETTGDRRLPVEVWAVGPEAPAHRLFAPHARRYYTDDRILYRHIVVERLGAAPGLVSPPRAARIALFLIRRGFHYVPTTRSGLLGFFRFRFFLRAAPRGVGTFFPARSLS